MTAARSLKTRQRQADRPFDRCFDEPATTTTSNPINAQVAILDRDNSSKGAVGGRQKQEKLGFKHSKPGAHNRTNTQSV
jgi:hypothetical protein